MYGNYVAPISQGKSLHDRYMENISRQYAMVLQKQAVKEQKKNMEPTGLYGFNTEGWSKEAKDAMLNLSNAAKLKWEESGYEEGLLPQLAQQLSNQHDLINNMWAANTSGKTSYINLLQDPTKHTDNETEVSESAEIADSKIEYSRNWGVQEYLVDPDNLTISISAYDLEGNPINEGQYFSPDQHPIAGANANGSIWNYAIRPRTTYTPLEMSEAYQGVVDTQLSNDTPLDQIEREVKDSMIAELNSGKHGRSAESYANNNGMMRESGDATFARKFADDAWNLMRQQLIDDGVIEETVEEVEGPPLDLGLVRITTLSNNATSIYGQDFPAKSENAVNFGKFIQNNGDVIQKALVEAGLRPDDISSGLIPQEIMYDPTTNKFTVISPMTPSGRNLLINIPLDPNDPSDANAISDIEAKYRRLYGLNCTLMQLVKGECDQFTSGDATPAASTVSWGDAPVIPASVTDTIPVATDTIPGGWSDAKPTIEK